MAAPPNLDERHHTRIKTAKICPGPRPPPWRYACKRPLSGRLKEKIAAPATAATAAIITKKLALSIALQKLPSHPAIKFPAKLVPSHRPIMAETMRGGAIFETSDRPIGET